MTSIIPHAHKQCIKCLIAKPLIDFDTDGRRSDGYNPYCKECFAKKLPVSHGMKECSKCATVKPVSAYAKHAKFKDGLNPYCKDCDKNRRTLHPVQIPIVKKCTKCGELKPSHAFYKDSSTRRTEDGLKSWCKECSRSVSHKPYTYQRHRTRHLRQLYGITVEEYNALFEKQKGLCAVCGRAETAIHYGRIATLAIDHCHVTGAVRGLLCANCNRALGLLGENPERIEALLKYTLERVLY